MTRGKGKGVERKRYFKTNGLAGWDVKIKHERVKKFTYS